MIPLEALASDLKMDHKNYENVNSKTVTTGRVSETF